MNIVNRVCSGSALDGTLEYKGGVLVQGTISGTCDVRGPLVVWHGGLLCGHIKVWGNLYLFGQIGTDGDYEAATVLECMGTAYISSTGVSNARLSAHRIKMYDGAKLNGPFTSLKKRLAIPELTDLHKQKKS